MRITLTPETDWGGRKLKPVRGVNHVRFVDEELAFRVTTDAPVSYILSGTSFILDREAAFILGADESLSDHPEVIARDWEERTRLYWKRWARSLAVPFEWQQAVIRAAITLKLCVYEETGGIVAALTTSVPEHEGSERNWDYRYCWIRDAYFTVTALNRLSGMGTLEHYMRWVRNIVAQSKGGHIQPVYGIGLEADLTEDFARQLPGYRGMGPVRVGNQAAEHVQHDVYGQVVLGVAQSFFDTRLMKRPGLTEFEQLEPVGERAFAFTTRRMPASGNSVRLLMCIHRPPSCAGRRATGWQRLLSILAFLRGQITGVNGPTSYTAPFWKRPGTKRLAPSPRRSAGKIWMRLSC
jgi:hypothetical protein